MYAVGGVVHVFYIIEPPGHGEERADVLLAGFRYLGFPYGYPFNLFRVFFSDSAHFSLAGHRCDLVAD